MNETFTLLKKNYPFLLATFVTLAVYCYQNYSNILNQIIKILKIYLGFVGLVFVNLQISKITCNQSMGYLFSINNIHHSGTTQASDIDHFPVSIEVHESAIQNNLMTFVILNYNTEHDLIEFTTLKKIEIRSLILDRTCCGPCKYNFRLNLLYLSKLLLENGSLENVCKMEAVFVNFSVHGSGWVLQLVNTLYIKIRKALPIRGSSFIPLLAKISNS